MVPQYDRPSADTKTGAQRGSSVPYGAFINRKNRNSLFEFTKWRTGGNDMGVTLAFLMTDNSHFIVVHVNGHIKSGSLRKCRRCKGRALKGFLTGDAEGRRSLNATLNSHTKLYRPTQIVSPDLRRQTRPP